MRRFLVVLVVALSACDSSSSGTPVEHSSAGIVAPTSALAAPLPPEVEAWNIYTSTDFGYSLRYPPTWFSLGNLGAPSTETYFSNHKDVGSPMNTGTDGVFMGLSADCQYWLGPNTRLVSKGDVTIGATSVPRYVVLEKDSDGAFYAADADVLANASCYRLTMIGSLSAIQANLTTYDLVLSSLRFSARAAPISSPHPTSQPT